MKQIVIEVDENAAQQWQYASPEKKEKLTKRIEVLIKNTDLENEDTFWPFVEDLSAKTKARGLSEAELDRILNER
ncbi:MAG: hypothetical protein EOP42_07305 [Sphingobacteriaceae bacterium]|nr:MAG: hypothetical protein EOP42_07305 [Sphingobacteriaceae bacterium]